jgi:hypothetical protein
MVVVYRLSPLTYRLVKPFGHVECMRCPISSPATASCRADSGRFSPPSGRRRKREVSDRQGP